MHASTHTHTECYLSLKIEENPVICGNMVNLKGIYKCNKLKNDKYGIT